MNMTIRPMTPAERKYAYNQSQQLTCQTSCIGHLRADFGSSGNEFYSSWYSRLPSLNDDAFKAEIDQVVNALREDSAYGGILASREKMGSYCRKRPESSCGPDSREYGFRADTEKYTYLLRLNPNPGEYNLYAYCYVKAHLDRHLKSAEVGIRFITPHYRELFRIPDGDQVRIMTADGRMLDRACRFIDETHVEVGSSLFHICEFAEKMERAGNTVVPLRSSLPDKCFAYDAEANAVVVIEKGVPGWELAGRRLNGMSGQEMADQLNQEEGVTRVQAAAMLAGAVHGWAAPEADPASYDALGRFHEPL